MANSTFSGPVRSEGGFQHLATNNTTGNQLTNKVNIETNGQLVIEGTNGNNVNRSATTPDRYYLNEYYETLPKLQGFLTGSETKDFGSIGDGNELIEDVAVLGAALGDFAMASLSVDTVDLTLTATVTAANVVTVSLGNFTGGAIDLASATLTVRTIPKLQSFGSIANPNFEVLGTNMTSALVTRNATAAGFIMTTAGADQDQSILAPNLANPVAWSDTLWGTENQTEWECSINPNAIDNQKFWAGLKLTNDQLIATDADQAYFKFQTDATNSEAFTDFTLLHFVHSVGGTDFISALPITVAANTIYHLKIVIDSDRKATIFVDGTQYDITTTSGSTGGTAVSAVAEGAAAVLSGALTDNVDLIPYIGIEAGAAAAEAIDVHWQAINRTIFE